MSDQASAVHGGDRGFAKLDLELNDYPGPLKTSLFGIQHVLVMFTAMVGGPLIVAVFTNQNTGDFFELEATEGRIAERLVRDWK